MIKLDKEDGESLSIVNENIEALKLILPYAFSDGKIDFDVLCKSLGDTVIDKEEKYSLSWHGKNLAQQIALSRTFGTLRPCPDESVDWETTKNLFIEGDNLEVLKLFQKSYAGKVKMIYIDPPYNTEGDFIYPDRFQDNLDSYLLYTGQLDENGLKNSTSIEVNGRKHTKWLNMMYPRLLLGRSLLSDDGLLLCHIDEHEISNIHHLLDEIFGPENNLGPIVWDKRNPKGDAMTIATQREYIVIYSKNLERLKEKYLLKRSKKNAEKMIKKATNMFSKLGKNVVPVEIACAVKKFNLSINLTDYEQVYNLEAVNFEYLNWLQKQSVSGGEADYKFIDDNGEVFQSVSMAWPNMKPAPKKYREPLIHPRTGKSCPIPERGWRYSPKTMSELMEKNQIIFGEDETTQPRRKYLLSENIPSILPFGGSDVALLKKLEIPFDNPKPVSFVKEILKYFLSDEDLFIDLFAGSATAAHASMELCVEQAINLRYILVQLPENLDSSKKELKNAVEFCEKIGKPLNLSEIGKERVRRSGELIRSENPNFKGDLGFKVFKLDSSNIRTWNPYNSDLDQTLHDQVERLVIGRNEQDILYEILLKRGIDLTTSIEQKIIVDKTIYAVGKGLLFVCLDKTITESEVEEIGQGITKWYQELDPKTDTNVYFRDSAFANDISKINMNAILEQNGIPHVFSL